jgi:acyl-CoA synthetase (NDP forming)
MTTPTSTSDQGFDVLAADGGIVRIRPAAAADREALLDLYGRTSDENLYRRFFYHGRSGIQAQVDKAIRPPDASHVALVAVDRGRLVGIGTYEADETGTGADFALLVDDWHHGRGIGTLLLEQLQANAHRNGIDMLRGDVLASNQPMLAVANALGPRPHMRYDAGIVEVELPTGDSSESAAFDLESRYQRAEKRSLAGLLSPQGIAVVGVSRRPNGIGHSIWRALVDGEFTGTLYPVNANGGDLEGTQLYRTVAEIGGPVDLAIVAVPAERVLDVADDCAAAGVTAMVVLSSGFGEDGPEGKQRQAELVRRCRAAGIRLVGPNCLGIVNTEPSVQMHATFAAVTPPAGALAVASQSGAVGISLLDHAARTGTGISSFVSLGNKADVSGNDLLAYWYDDPTTAAVALYLESVGNPRRFARVARAISRRKPVLVVKSGRTESGARAGASHTAAAAAPDVTVDALFRQAGVIRCESLGELLEAARLLVTQPLPAGGRIGIVGNAGGINVLAADAADGAGLTLPTLPEAIQAEIRSAGAGVASAANPVDLGAAATPPAMAATIKAVANEDVVDGIIVVYTGTVVTDVNAMLATIESTLAEIKIPAAAILLGIHNPPIALGAVPVFSLPEQAIAAFGHAVRYHQWRQQPLGQQPAFPDIDERAARTLVAQALAGGGGWQPSEIATRLLSYYGVPIAPGSVVRSADEAVEVAAIFGYPVVLKAADPALVHKSDRGVVKLGLADGDAVRLAYNDIATALSNPASPVLVQPLISGGVELVAGIVHDQLFGSLIMLGLGGVHTDLLGDRSLRLLPVTDRDAAGMWRELRGAPLLTGFRGATPVATDAVEDLVARLGRLADDFPEVAELDLNPVLAGPKGVVAVDVKLRLATVGIEPSGSVRALREPTD